MGRGAVESVWAGGVWGCGEERLQIRIYYFWTRGDSKHEMVNLAMCEMKSWRSWGLAPLILNFGVGWRWVVSFMIRPSYWQLLSDWALKVACSFLHFTYHNPPSVLSRTLKMWGVGEFLIVYPIPYSVYLLWACWIFYICPLNYPFIQLSLVSSLHFCSAFALIWTNNSLVYGPV
jgi:hypothetical protein